MKVEFLFRNLDFSCVIDVDIMNNLNVNTEMIFQICVQPGI